MEIISSCTVVDFMKFVLCDPVSYAKCTDSLKKGFVFQALRILSIEYPREIYSTNGFDNVMALNCLHKKLCKKGQRLPQWVWDAVKNMDKENPYKDLKSYDKDVVREYLKQHDTCYRHLEMKYLRYPKEVKEEMEQIAEQLQEIKKKGGRKSAKK